MGAQWKNIQLNAIARILVVGILAGTASFMFMPFIQSGIVNRFIASALGVAITIPLILHFLDVPGNGFDFKEYYSARRIRGIIADFLLVLLVAFAPAVIFLYGLLNLGLFSPVPEAFAASIGIYKGYSAFLFRNRTFYTEETLDLVF